jgi:hypothetical protein
VGLIVIVSVRECTACRLSTEHCCVHFALLLPSFLTWYPFSVLCGDFQYGVQILFHDVLQGMVELYVAVLSLQPSTVQASQPAED